MPCTDGGPSWDQIQREQEEHLILTKLACEYCRKLTTDGKPIPEYAATWWKRHQAADKAREEMEAEYAHRKETKAKAISKLTADERAVLGI